MPVDQDKLEKLKASVRTGGKGSMRRKKKAVHKTATTDDKRLQNTLKRLGVNNIPGIEEVNLFRDNGTVIHFKNPKVPCAIAIDRPRLSVKCSGLGSHVLGTWSGCDGHGMRIFGGAKTDSIHSRCRLPSVPTPTSSAELPKTRNCRISCLASSTSILPPHNPLPDL